MVLLLIVDVQVFARVEEHVGRIPTCVFLAVRAIVHLNFAVFDHPYFGVVELYPLGVVAVRFGERPIMAELHSATIVDDDAFEIIRVVFLLAPDVARLLGV